MKTPTPRKRKRKADNPVRTRLRAKRGLASDLAAHLGVERTTVWMWVGLTGRVPAEYVIEVGKYLRIARHRIRPDLYQAR